MDKDQFWEIMSEARADQYGIVNLGIQKIGKRLKSLDLESVLKFQHYFDEYKKLANKSLVVGVACLLADCEKDSYVDLIDYYLEQLIILGKRCYFLVLQDPDAIAEVIENGEADEYDAELLNKLTFDVVQEIAPDLDYYRLYAAVSLTPEEKRQMKEEIKYAPNIDAKWKNLEEAKTLLPKLAALLQREQEEDDYW